MRRAQGRHRLAQATTPSHSSANHPPALPQAIRVILVLSSRQPMVAAAPLKATEKVTRFKWMPISRSLS